MVPRLCFLDADDHILKRHDFVAENDSAAAALEIARKYVDGHDVEVWQQHNARMLLRPASAQERIDRRRNTSPSCERTREMIVPDFLDSSAGQPERLRHASRRRHASTRPSSFLLQQLRDPFQIAQLASGQQQ